MSKIGQLPVTDFDNVNHLRRHREVTNSILKFDFDDSRVQTTAEKLAGVTPINAAFPPGDVRRYGAKLDGTTDDLQAFQNALNISQEVFIPNGTMFISGSAFYNDFNSVRCESRNAVVKAPAGTKIIVGTNQLTERRNHFTWYNGTIDGTNRGTAGGIAFDFLSTTMAKVFGAYIINVETGCRSGGSGSLGAFYNELHGVDINGVVYGVVNGTLGNDNKVFGGRCNNCTIGTIDDNCSGNAYFGFAIEVFTTGHQSSPTAAATNIRYVCSRLENQPTSGTGFDIKSLAQVTSILFPQCTGLTTDFSDAAADTNVWADTWFQVVGVSRIKRYRSVTATINFPSIAANSFATDTLVTVSGVSSNASVYATPPSSIEAGLIWCAIPTAGGVYIRLYNGTAVAIDPASATWRVDAWDH